VTTPLKSPTAVIVCCPAFATTSDLPFRVKVTFTWLVSLNAIKLPAESKTGEKLSTPMASPARPRFPQPPSSVGGTCQCANQLRFTAPALILS
jgi:hypothetical protein